MAIVSRVVGTTSEYALVFIPDATVSTGAGLANIQASNVRLSWSRAGMSATSSQTLVSTSAFGTWAVSAFAQADSVSSLGWYGVAIPNGVFVGGRTAYVHLSFAPSMAPVPILYELTAAGFDNQTAISTQASTMPVNTVQILGSTPVTSAAGTLKSDVLTVLGSTPVTTAAGVLATAWDLSRTANLTSTIAATGMSLSTNQDVNVNRILGSTPVTTAAGVLATAFDLSRISNPTSTVALTGLSINYVTTAGSAAAIADKSGYGVSSVADKGGYGVSSVADKGGYGVSSNADKTAYALTSAYDFAKGTVAATESYAADGAAATPAQLLYQIWSILAERSVVSTTMTTFGLDGLTSSMAFTLDSVNPSVQTRSA
jgi:hypothetical protein